MSINYPHNNGPVSVTDREDVMFAAQPVWDRNRKRRPGLGLKPAGAPPSTMTAASHSTTSQPIRRKVEHRTSTAPVALAAGVVGLAALAGAGWFMTRDAGVPQMTPGEVETMEVATAPVAPPVPPLMDQTRMAMAPMATPETAPPQARSTPVAPRSAPARAAAPSVDESGMDASTSAALPEGPLPYTTLNPDTVTAPPPVESSAPPVPETPPIQTEPTPAPENPVGSTQTPSESPPL